jgi:diguanylate cyclase (GGDEF)-like protein/PAS domain S-box-containing protein
MVLAEHWISLIANLAVVALVISAWVHGQFVFAGRQLAERHLAFGVVMGLGAVASMVLSIQMDGVLFDLRSSLIAIAGFFGGPLSAVVAATIAISYRAFVVGGASVSVAIVGITTAGLVGIVVARAMRGRANTLPAAMLLALAVASISVIVSAGMRLTLGIVGMPLSLPVAGMNAVATVIACFYIMRHNALERERDLLRAAFRHSPDYQYVKAPDGRYVAVNVAVAHHYGYSSIAEIVGKTDFDLVDEERAREMQATDRRVLETGAAANDLEEKVIDGIGREAWYLTSKVPLHDGDGAVIGLAGVTRDITAQKRLQQEIIESRNQLNYVLSEMSDGIARFDANSILIYCNQRYRDLFPLTGDVRRPGQSLHSILTEVARTGEQMGIPPDEAEDWVERTASTLNAVGEQEIEIAGGSWLLVRTRPTSDGSSLVVVSDVTRIKLAETALLSLTEQLKLLASTDGLTGLTNRRAFDQALANELTRSRRSDVPLALLMIDVDRFKSFNDLYGHPAGDDVLRAVGQALNDTVRRPGDIPARYGGEEFAVILPATDEAGAVFLAESFRLRLHALAMPHTGNQRGIVTASIGVAVFGGGDEVMNATELLGRADEALYDAKGAGRDGVGTWRPREDDASPVRLKH